MKKIVLLFVFLVFLTSCKSIEEPELLCEIGLPKDVSSEELNNEDFLSFLSQLDIFSSTITEALCTNEVNNTCISPLSIFMGLSLGAVCSESEELTSVLGVDKLDIDRNLPLLYNAVFKNKDANKVFLNNSIWLNNSLQYRKEIVEELAKKYYCAPYKVDYKNQNELTNQQIQKFIKESTNGLIDQNFEFAVDTLFLLINTLYFKDSWSFNELSLTNQNYDFLNQNGSKTNRKLMTGKYIVGKAQEEETYSHFYTTTNAGYKLCFVVPKPGHSLKNVFTRDTILQVSNYSYEKNPKQRTRCIFPSFEGKYDEDILVVLEEKFSLNKVNFDRLLEENSILRTVQHVAKIKVDTKGIEGGAVTILDAAPTAPAPDEVIEYYDFVVDRNFGYILMDRNGIPLFTGMISNL